MSDKLQEVKVKEVKDENGNVVERITETWVEKVPMEMKSRVVEKISSVPVVTEKIVESYCNGQVVDSQSECLAGMTKVCETSNCKSEKLQGLSDMKDRVALDAKKVKDIVMYFIIGGLVVYIAYLMLH